MPQRQHVRVSPTTLVEGEVLVPRPLVVGNISVAGVEVDTADPLDLHSIRTLRLHLAGRSLVVKGRVCHVSMRALDGGDLRHTSGIEFIDLTDDARAALEAFVGSPVADILA